MADWRTRDYVPDSEEEDVGDLSEEQDELSDLSILHTGSLIAASSSRSQTAPTEQIIHGQNTKAGSFDRRSDHSKEQEQEELQSGNVGFTGTSTPSDDEVDELALPANNIHKLKARARSKISLDKLFTSDDRPEDQGNEHLEVPFQDEDRILGSAQQTDFHLLQGEPDVGDENSISSRLSSVASTPPPPSPISSPTQPTERSTARSHKEPMVLIQSLNIPRETGTHHSRSFRNRKPIQLNPFAIEYQRYAKEWQSHGMKPIRVQHQDQRRAEEDPDVDLSEPENEESQTRTVQPNTESASLHSSPIRDTTAFDFPSSPGADQPEFPDIDSLLRNPLQGTLRDGYKRRKLAHTYTKKATTLITKRNFSPTSISRPPTTFKAPRVYADTSFTHSSSREAQKRNTFRRDPDSGQENTSVPRSSNAIRTPDDLMLLTPTQSSSSTPRIEEALENHDLQTTTLTTPQQLQTPTRSSEARHNEKGRSPILVSSESDSKEVLPPRRRPFLVEDGQESSNEDYRHLLRAQRQTKGVLPASWHRLNFMGSNTKDNRISKVQKPRTRSPLTETRKGLARPVFSSTGRRTVQDQPHSLIAIDSSSQSDDGWTPKDFRDDPSIETFLNKENAAPVDIISDADNEDMEEDVIDDMSGPVPRSSHNSRKQVPRQKRITDSFQQTRNPAQSRANPKLALKQKHGLNEVSRPSSKRKRPPKVRKARERVGILDVLETNHQTELPDFLIYASRTANLRQNKGRHSPSKKVFRMHRQEDTQTIRESLDKWKIGQIRRVVPSRRRKPRRPLVERTANNTAQSFPDTTEEDSVMLDNPVMGVPIVSLSNLLVKDQRPQVTSLQPVLGTARNSPLPSRRVQILKPPPQVRVKSATDTAYVPAQLETEHLSHRKRDLNLESQKQSMVERFLETRGNKGEVETCLDAANKGFNASKRPSAQRKKIQRKHLPRQFIPRLDCELEEPIIHLSEEDAPKLTNACQDSSIQPQTHVSSSIGFGPFERDYSVTFDFEHLPDGQLFESSSLIGSGVFGKILDRHEMCDSTDTSALNPSASAPAWRAWNETVSDQVHDYFNRIAQALQNNSLRLSDNCKEQESLTDQLDDVIYYLHGNLTFLDPIDRKGFVERLTAWLEVVIEATHEVLDDAPDANVKRVVAKIGSRISLIAFQLKNISDNNLVPPEWKDCVARLFDRAIHQTAKALFPSAFEDLAQFSKDTVSMWLHPSRFKARISVESFVMVLHLLKQLPWKLSIWELLRLENLFPLYADVHDIREAERIWRGLFCLLPYLEVSHLGTISKGNLKKPMDENWITVKELVEPVLNAAFANKGSQSVSLRRYCQTALSRCLHLIQYWRWYNSDGIITCLFDIFARNNLGDLPGEENRGSPQFLESLSDRLIPQLAHGERCFNIFLKIVGCGLRGLRSITQDKRIGNSVFRLIPNHDRRLPKDQQLKEDDLNAVRNQFDLLCVLYWAAPASYRIRLSYFQHLIDLEASHRQACHLVVKSWLYLVEYQLSTLEPLPRLDAFVTWIKEILEKTVKLHRLARTEVENDARTAELSFGQTVPLDARESIIASSQRHIEALMKDSLQSLKRAIRKADARVALSKRFTAGVTQILSLFDPKCPRINHVVADALDVIRVFISKANASSDSDDSQDFGDLSIFDELAPNTADNGPITLDEGVYKALYSLLSDAFGADSLTDDDFLTQVVEIWLQTARMEVQAGNKTWNRYIDPFGQESWQSLRNTEQKRRLTPFFYSTLIDLDPSIYEENKSFVLNDWIISLVERESLVKYQPLLTTALLNQDVTEPLLGNHPFRKSRASDKFDIALHEFLDRRLTLISYLLSNMRESASFMTYHNLPEKNSAIQGYAELLRHLMNAMKSSYQNLGHGSEVQSAYVVFVQRVVELLQQYTVDICKVDPFFIDATNFPLPDDDPEYIMSHLKNLGLKLSLPGGPQQLSAFLQTMCERAAAKDQQTRSTSLLQKAMEDTFASIDEGELSFCGFMIIFVVPIYISIATETACGWIPGTTILAALPSILDLTIFHLDSFQQTSIEKIQSILFDVLYSIEDAIHTLYAHPELLSKTHTYRTLSPLVDILSCMLEALEYLLRLRTTCKSSRCRVQNVRKTLFYFLVNGLSGEPEMIQEESKDRPARSQLSSNFQTAQKFAVDQLRSSFDPASRGCKWKVDSRGRYLLLRGGKWEELMIDLGSLEEERGKFETKVLGFVRRMEKCPSLMAGFRNEVEDRFSGRVSPRFAEQRISVQKRVVF